MPRILVVDDEKNVLTSLKIGLKRKNFSVVEASTGQQALELLDQEKFDILLSDIKMVPMDGYTLAAQARKAHPALGIILMSAYGFEESQYETIETISCSRITKPFSIEILLKAIYRESNKGLYGRVLVLGDARSRKSIREIIETVGYSIENVPPSIDLKKLLRSNQWSCLVIDGDSLDEHRLKLLNDIDRLAPKIPVLLLARKDDNSKSADTKANRLTVLNKDKFLNDSIWAETMMKKIVH